MSYEYSIYSPREQPVLKEELKSELERHGWQIVFCCGATEIEKIIPSQGPVQNGITVVTCEMGGANFYRFQESIENHDITALNEMLNQGGIGGVDFCGIWWSPFDASQCWKPETLQVLAQKYGENYLRALQQARIHYSFDASYDPDFLIAVGSIIADLVGGVIEDPQQGIVEFKTARK